MFEAAQGEALCIMGLGRWCSGLKHVLWSQTSLVQILALQRTSCKTLGQQFNLSVLHFPCLSNRDNHSAPTLRLAVTVMCLEHTLSTIWCKLSMQLL